MSQRQQLGERPDFSGQISDGENHAGEEEHRRKQAREEKVEVINRPDKRGDKQGERSKHNSGDKSKQRHDKAVRQRQYSEDGQDTQHGKGEEESLASRPEDFTDDKIIYRYRRGEHSVIYFFELKANECAESALERGGEHCAGHKQAGSEEFDVRQSIHCLGDIPAEAQADTGEEQERFEKRRQSVAE